MTLIDRIQTRLKKLEKTERSASLEAGLSDSYLRNIRDGKSLSPRIDTLEKIAVALKTSANWLITGEGEEEQIKQDIEETRPLICAPNAFKPIKLPVYGQDVAGVDGEFNLENLALYDVLCPPHLFEKKGAYCIIIAGDTMAPRYQDGEHAFIDPSKRVKKGDYVLAQVKLNANDSAIYAYVKRFISHNSSELVLEQFNPYKILRFPHKNVVAVHYITLAGHIN